MLCLNIDVQAPCENHWGNGLDAMKHALDLEKDVYQSLLDLHKIAEDNKDPQVWRVAGNSAVMLFATIKWSISVKKKKRKRVPKKSSYRLGEYEELKATTLYSIVNNAVIQGSTAEKGGVFDTLQNPKKVVSFD